MAIQKGLSLVAIPCWWSGTQEMLGATIHFCRPDILVHSELIPVSLNPPMDYFADRHIPLVGELMSPSFPISHLSLESHVIDANDWWMGEKYDGIRCCWNSSMCVAYHITYTRYANDIFLLQSIVALLPSIFMDSEIWFGRGQFLDTTSVLSKENNHPHWTMLRITAFDIPSTDFQEDILFEQRYTFLLGVIHHDHPFILVVARIACGNQNLRHLLDNVISEGGEGVILQKRASVYEQGRSSSLLKLKTSEGDQEGIVASIGEHRSVVVKLPSGIVFTVPAPNVHVASWPTPGDIVTFSFEMKSRQDVPVNPVIYRVRGDVSWGDVVYSFHKERQFINESSNVSGFKQLPSGYWTQKKMREYMEQFAVSRNLNPLDPRTWRNSYKAFVQTPNGKKILRKFNDRYFEAVKRLFPEVTFDPLKFQHTLWNKLENRREFFERYAKEHGFDSQKPENWYSQAERLASVKGLQRILFYHGHSVHKALIDLFPNIGLDVTKFPIGQTLWSKPINRRLFFENFAKVNCFEPLNPENWYMQKDKILLTKGARLVLSYHASSISQALIDLFPEIPLNSNEFKIRQIIALWRKTDNRRTFFEEYAKKHKFDPLEPKNWYTISRMKFLEEKGARMVLSYHGESIVHALLDLFPNIGLEKSKFVIVRAKWDTAVKRRKFFEDYAKIHKFDHLVPKMWYTQPKEKILSTKWGSQVLSYHGGDMVTALMELFPDIGLQKSKFPIRQTFWRKYDNRRAFFENYAKQNGFDPLIAENWYSQPRQQIMAEKGASVVIFHHGKSIANALIELFPNIGLDSCKFQAHLFSWRSKENRRLFFENYAKKKNFDFSVTTNWYLQSRDNIMAERGAIEVMSFYGDSISKALLDLFPEIGLTKALFRTHLHTLWSASENRRKFFENYAKENKIDPKIPDNWYSQPRDKILAAKGAQGVIAHHGNSVARALLELFPDIGLENFQFRNKRRRE